MYNVKVMKEAREKHKDVDKHKKADMREFQFLDLRDLNDGAYYIRFFPKNPASNPNGFRVAGKHFLEGNISNLNGHGDVKKVLYNCAAPEPKSKNRCYFCELYAVLDGEGFYANPAVDASVVKAARGLAPDIEYWFVISLMATCQTIPNDANPQYPNYKYTPTEFGGEHEHGKILQISNRGYGKDLIDEIFAVLGAESKRGFDATESDESGSYLILHKEGGKYSVTMSDQQEVELQNQDLLKKYPAKFNTMGDKKMLTPVKAAAFIQDKDACWWGRSLRKYADLSPDGEGEEDDDDLPFDLEGDME